MYISIQSADRDEIIFGPYILFDDKYITIPQNLLRGLRTEICEHKLQI
jgi:hypothetical protein